jgi:hypothetical protein
MHFGSSRCPYLDQSECHNCGGVIPAEEGSDFEVHPNRKFDSLGFAYHPSCEFKEHKTMQLHQQRVVDEKKELDVKLEKLSAFIQGPIFQTLKSDEQERLTRQSKLMDQYSGVLAERIEAF